MDRRDASLALDADFAATVKPISQNQNLQTLIHHAIVILKTATQKAKTDLKNIDGFL